MPAISIAVPAARGDLHASRGMGLGRDGIAKAGVAHQACCNAQWHTPLAERRMARYSAFERLQGISTLQE